MLDKADEALAALITATQNREAQEPYQDARKVIAAGREKLETEFHKAYLTEFRQHTSKVKEAESFSDVDASLTLVGEEDLEETLKFKELATKVRKYCDEELAALDQRVGVLLGDANLQAENNPFSPETICDAYQQACHALETSMKVRTVLRKLFDDHVVDAVRAIYKDVNALLVKNSILPKIRYGAKKSADKAKAAGGKAGAAAAKDDDNKAAEPAEGGAAAEQNLFSLLQNLVGGAGGGGGPGGGVALPPGAVILQGAELLGSLTKLQKGDASGLPGGLPAEAAASMSAAMSAGTTNVLRELKTSSFGAGLVQMDATTLDIVSMLFDQLFDDPKIPAGLKGLIGRLQIPLLKVAIADKSFFAKKTHPARQMLDTFGDIAVRLPTEFSADSATFVHLEVIVQHLIDNFQDDIAVFDGARDRLLGVIAEHDKQVETRSRVTAERIEQTENLAVAKTAAEDEVKVRVQTHKIPGPVLEFLVEHWLRLLLLAHVKAGRNGAEWKDAIEAMDQLIWSVEPMRTPDDRRKLAATVPGLVRHLIAGFNTLGTEAPARERFFGELMKYHTDALEPKKAKPKAAGGKAADKPAEPAAAEAASAKAAPAASLDFTAPVTIKNPYGEGQVQVTGLDFTPQPVDPKQRAAAKASLKSSLAVDPPADMEMGTWVEFRPKGDGEEHRVAKLLFVSPKKTRYLFSDRRGQNVLELSRAEIVRRLRSGEAVRLDDEPKEPLFDRIMTGLVDKLKTPAKVAA